MYAKKIKKKVKKLRFFPVTVMTPVHSSRKLSFSLEFLKSLSSASLVLSQVFFSCNTNNKLYYFCLPLNYLPVYASKLT